MKIIFIAAGSSTRLGKYTESIPKGLLKIHDKSIIQTQLDLFKHRTVRNEKGNKMVIYQKAYLIR